MPRKLRLFTVAVILAFWTCITCQAVHAAPLPWNSGSSLIGGGDLLEQMWTWIANRIAGLGLQARGAVGAPKDGPTNDPNNGAQMTQKPGAQGLGAAGSAVQP
jgi:hypothetical protein